MPTLFLDRDGVLNKEVNYLHRVDDFEFTPNCIEGLCNFKARGFDFIVVTNQAGIARGLYTEDEYHILTRHLETQLNFFGIDFMHIYHCPHHPDGSVAGYAMVCECRKPKPGMFHQAIKEYDVDIKKSIMVGDKRTDLLAARAAGVEACVFVETGHPISLADKQDFPTYCDLLELSQSDLVASF